MLNNNEKPKISISFNSPVILIFTAICFAAFILNLITFGASNDYVFSVYRSSLLNPLTYLRFFGHIFGHVDFSHLMGNMMMILVIGPLLEEKYGKGDIIFVIAITAVVTGLINFIFFPSVQLLGASGVVFAFILLSSFTSFEERKIPLTFILVAVIYIGEQIYSGVFIQDNISNLTHIVGGIVGSGFGFVVNNVNNKVKR